MKAPVEDVRPAHLNDVRPTHYKQHRSGVEAWDIVEWLPFNLGNAIKYLFRADHKGSSIEDLRKAVTYLRRERERDRNWYCSGICDPMGCRGHKRDERDVPGTDRAIGAIRKVIAADPGGVLKDVLVILGESEWENDDSIVEAVKRIEDEIERRVDGCGACAETKHTGGVWNGREHTCGMKVEPIVVTATPTKPDVVLDSLERLLAKATPTPWEDEHDMGGATVQPHVARVLGFFGGDGEEPLANAALIAELRNAAPRLIAACREVEHLRWQRDDLQRCNTALVIENRALREKAPSILRGQVRAFMHAFDQPILDRPGVPLVLAYEGRDPHAWVRLRLELVIEEAIELVMACIERGGDADPDGEIERMGEAIVSRIRTMGPLKIDLPAVADALGDLFYVTQGAFLTFGINDAPVLAEIHGSNMAKIGGPIDPVTKKKLKPPGWTPPDVAGVLRAQGWVP